MHAFHQQSESEIQQQVSDVEGAEFIKCNELLALRVENQSATATVFLQGAQLASYQPKSHKPVIWLSDRCDYTAGKPLRGGIPVCWPWFGDLSKNPQAIIDQLQNPGAVSAHGFVRDIPWRLISATMDGPGTTSLTFGLDIQADSVAGWPYSCRLTMAMRIGAELRIEFTVENRGAAEIATSCALHSYFSVSDIASATVEGLDGIDYIDSLQDWQRYTQEGLLKINKETDRIYQSITGSVAIVDAGWSRTIRLTQSNTKSLVVWNPWIEKAKRLSHFGDDDYLNMLCLETAQVLEHAQTIKAGGRHRIELSIDILWR